MNLKRRSENNPSPFWSSNCWSVLRTLLLIFATTFLICLIVFAAYMLSLDSKIDVEVEAMKLNYSSIVYYLDEDGNEHEYERLYDSQNRTWVNLEDMPAYLKDAAIAIEDHRFMKHNGVDWKRTFAASVNLFFKMKSDFGASTITQQLIKNLTGDNQDSVKRKLQEIMRALYLERHYDKETIIELYLNTIYLGKGCYGVGTAARTYFDKDVSELTLAESASLIGITNLPTYYNPYLNPDNNRARRIDIINRMYELDMISEEDRDAAISEEIVFNKNETSQDSSNVQSYFVDQVIEDLIDDLMQERGYSKQIAIRTIYSGGLKIYATIDPELQKSMDSVFEDNNVFPRYSSSVQPECAMVLMDPQNGDILALRGGRGEKSGARILNRATQTKRPPGSSIKPISVYAPAIEYGLITPFSVEDDAPLKVLNGTAYPKNETRVYTGRTTIVNAVMQSLNTVSMRTLEKLSIERSYNFLTANLGISSLNSKGDMNLAPLSLGQLTNGITVLEMAAAYVPFANGGTYYEPRTYTKVLDSQGEVLIEKDTPSITAMSEKTAQYVNYMLQQVVSGGTGTYAKLANGMPAAAKTGTSNNDEDRWFVGYTPYYVGATWFGYDQPKYISKSLSPALTVWKKVMDKAHSGLPVKKFSTSTDFVSVDVCSCSGLLPTANCSADARGSKIVAGYFHKDDVPTKYCDVHTTVEIDTTTNMLATEFCPAESRKTVSLMELDRFFPLPDVIVEDEQYCIHKSTPSDGNFYFSPTSSNPMNMFCTTHISAPQIPDVTDDEEDSEFNTEDEIPPSDNHENHETDNVSDYPEENPDFIENQHEMNPETE